MYPYTNQQKISMIKRFKAEIPFSDTLNRYIEIEFQKLAKTIQIQFVDYEPYQSYIEMVERFNREKILLISSLHCENNIFGSVAMNCKFRALHDYDHIKQGLNFTPEQELILNYNRLQEASAHLNKFDLTLLNIETAGQIKHYLETGSFPENQRLFTISELEKCFVR